MRFLALDWGTVRIGAAVSDPDGKIAFPLDKIIERKSAIEEIKKIINELKIEKVLVGMPIGLSGQVTESTDRAERFILQLQKQIAPSIELLDERFSSVAAEKVLSGNEMAQKDQRNIKDNIAAQIILQQYLDTNKKTNN
ncbi:MAG: Holliday junction resolvase RuvX [Candidatus Doudnabacteria bacterium]|nr:Holliday junction resolvase RuvX [Candidatus Doudnabacteria bacterium]